MRHTAAECESAHVRREHDLALLQLATGDLLVHRRLPRRSEALLVGRRDPADGSHLNRSAVLCKLRRVVQGWPEGSWIDAAARGGGPCCSPGCEPSQRWRDEQHVRRANRSQTANASFQGGAGQPWQAATPTDRMSQRAGLDLVAGGRAQLKVRLSEGARWSLGSDRSLLPAEYLYLSISAFPNLPPTPTPTPHQVKLLTTYRTGAAHLAARALRSSSYPNPKPNPNPNPNPNETLTPSP